MFAPPPKKKKRFTATGTPAVTREETYDERNVICDPLSTRTPPRPHFLAPTPEAGSNYPIVKILWVRPFRWGEQHYFPES